MFQTPPVQTSPVVNITNQLNWVSYKGGLLIHFALYFVALGLVNFPILAVFKLFFHMEEMKESLLIKLNC